VRAGLMRFREFDSDIGGELVGQIF
jgi:hypothetical protein